MQITPLPIADVYLIKPKRLEDARGYFSETYRRDLLYRCFFDERAPGFAGNARIIARSEGGMPIAVEFPVLNGRVIFLPSAREASARWIVQKESKALVATFRELLGHGDVRVYDDSMSEWANSEQPTETRNDKD